MKQNLNRQQQNLVNELKKNVGDFLEIEIKSLNININCLDVLVNYDPDDDESLQREFILQPAQFAKFAVLLAQAKDALARVEMKFKKWKRSKRTEASKKISKFLEDRKIKKGVTNDDIESYIEDQYSDECDEFENKILRYDGRPLTVEQFIEKI